LRQLSTTCFANTNRSLSVIPILLLIARSKLVPDFALTIHGINLIITSLYTRSIPNTISWWVLQICSATLMIALGIWACQWRELKPMAFGGRSKQTTGTSAGNGHIPGPHDAEAGFEMGTSSTGAGRDGAGTYEMVGMAPKEPA
jgi:ABC-type nickel/cobalt efflux system permease component RcnA